MVPARDRSAGLTTTEGNFRQPDARRMKPSGVDEPLKVLALGEDNPARFASGFWPENVRRDSRPGKSIIPRNRPGRGYAPSMPQVSVGTPVRRVGCWSGGPSWSWPGGQSSRA